MPLSELTKNRLLSRLPILMESEQYSEQVGHWQECGFCFAHSNGYVNAYETANITHKDDCLGIQLQKELTNEPNSNS